MREPTPGKCHALNRALRDLELGEIVVFTDDDVSPDPGWLEAIVSVCERWPDHSVFGGRIDASWPTGVPLPAWAKRRQVQMMAFSAHHVAANECEYPANHEPYGPNYWVRRGALAGLQFRTGLGPHPTRRTLGDETAFLRELRRRGFNPVYSPLACVKHRIERERTTRGAVYQRAFQYGRGAVHAEGVPEQHLLRASLLAWRLRLASNVGLGALGVLGAVFEPDEDERFQRIFARTITLAKNLEALRCARHATPNGALALVPAPGPR